MGCYMRANVSIDPTQGFTIIRKRLSLNLYNIPQSFTEIFGVESQAVPSLVTLIIYIYVHNYISISIGFRYYKPPFGEQIYNTPLQHIHTIPQIT